MTDSELENLVEEIVEERLEQKLDQQPETQVSRRGALGIAGLIGLGAVGAGTGSVAAVENHSLSEDLDCNENDLVDMNNLRAGHTYSSYFSEGGGNGNIQLYDNNADEPFFRASEDPNRSGPGPVQFNSPIRGVPEDAAGGDITPGPLRIEDDVVLTGHSLQNVGSIGGNLTGGEQLESLIGDHLSISNGQLNAAAGELSDDLQARLDDAITRLEVVGGTANQWRVGPSEPTGGPHRNGSFGLLFEVDRPAYFGECQIQADTAGQFTPALYEYDPDTDELVEQIDTITIQATGNQQTIFLDFLVEEPGQYLLTRLLPAEKGEEGDDNDNLDPAPDSIYKPEDDTIELYRTDSYDTGNLAADSQHGVTHLGSHNPYFTHWDGPEESNYYYYFNLEVSSADSA